ncbi:hypothetical protein THAOC_07452 [Thalassiosira oceanica]|uniref:Uncharacterized protein n=1 Tax=Thalassiosira oceanica TaxID=159749 RepID=K0TKE7_THAOC|nr:hypothetical protein THAOC_07452 [Thalassiosira oceanica]|eukprot:EJK71137.1 hypothetical protein THAOC_07452 [Thalassiosira oceanica]
MSYANHLGKLHNHWAYGSMRVSTAVSRLCVCVHSVQTRTKPAKSRSCVRAGVGHVPPFANTFPGKRPQPPRERCAASPVRLVAFLPNTSSPELQSTVHSLSFRVEIQEDRDLRNTKGEGGWAASRGASEKCRRRNNVEECDRCGGSLAMTWKEGREKDERCPRHRAATSAIDQRGNVTRQQSSSGR